MRRFVARRARAGAVALVAVLMALGVAAPAVAFADAGDGGLTVRSVDATAFPTVHVTVRAAADLPDASAISLTENGKAVDGVRVVPMRETSAAVGTVVVLDTSAAMRTNDRLAAMKNAVHQFIAGRATNELIEVVAAGSPARVVLGFTQDRAQVLAAVDALGTDGGLALWDGVTVAANNLLERRDLQPNIVVVAGGADQASTVGAASALSSAQVAKALVFGTAVHGSAPFGTGDLSQVAARSGGSFVDTASPDTLPGALDQLGHAADNQFEITYASTADANHPIDIAIRAGSVSSTAVVAPGTVASGTNVHPSTATPAWVPSFLDGSAGKLVATGAVVVAAGLGAFALLLLVRKDTGSLDAHLRPYAEVQGEEGADPAYEVVLAETGFVRRAVDTTARFADKQGVLEKIEQKLEQAAMPVRAAEALFFWLAAVVLGVALGLVLGGPFGAAIAAFLVGLGPFAFLNQKASRRKRAFTSLLPETLQMASSTLRSGFSLLQGVEAVSQEVAEPMGSELRRVLVEARLGRPLEDALQDAADRMGSADFDWVVMAIRIQREVGGNLAELLDTVSETMVQRERLRGDVKALTAEGRMSAIVLGFLPFGMGAIMWSLNPSYMNLLFTDSLGKIMVAVAVTLAVSGFLWMKKMIQVEA